MTVVCKTHMQSEGYMMNLHRILSCTEDALGIADINVHMDKTSSDLSVNVSYSIIIIMMILLTI